MAIAEGLWQELCMALNDREESAGILFAGRAEEEGRLTLCINRIEWVPAGSYELRSPRELRIDSAGWMPALARAATEGWQPIFFHTHPGADPSPSRLDRQVAAALAPVFETRTGRSYASLILGGEGPRPRFSGTVEGLSIERVRIVGDRLRLLFATEHAVDSGGGLETFDRQVRAFGHEGQRLLAALRVGLVGAGGTGSAVFEQLVRLGVGTIVVVDDDELSATNLTRIHGSRMADVGEAKVDVLARSAAEIGLGTHVETHRAKVSERPAFEALRGCDVVFGCTDDNAGRAVLSRLAYYYCLPVIDVGVRIGARNGEVSGLEERLSVIAPGAPCLHCRGRIDPHRLREEQLPDSERAALAAEGYAEGLADPDPAVLPYTTMVAAYAVDELLQRLFGLAVGESVSSEILVRPLLREVRRLGVEARDGHFCTDSSLVGRGDIEPPLGWGWP